MSSQDYHLTDRVSVIIFQYQTRENYSATKHVVSTIKFRDTKFCFSYLIEKRIKNYIAVFHGLIIYVDSLKL